VLGPIFGAKLNIVVGHLNKMKLEKLMSMVEMSTSDYIKVDAFDIPITGVRFQPINKKDSMTKMEKDLAVVLDTKITQSLEMEGIAREIVHRVQTLRRDAEFELTDQVKLSYFTESVLIESAINTFEDHIMTEVLATTINKTSSNKNSKMIEYTIRGDLLFIEVLSSSNP
jgi:isoleucyl-tRNA synthetase